MHVTIYTAILSMETVDESESCQGAYNGDNIEDNPLIQRHEVEERIWEFPIDRRSVLDPD
jgi:hypothetical protein